MTATADKLTTNPPVLRIALMIFLLCHPNPGAKKPPVSAICYAKATPALRPLNPTRQILNYMP